jgi:Tfp pilus assembly protein PilF
MEEKEYQKAIYFLSEAIKIDPSDIFSYVKRATAYGRIGDRKSALADYRRALPLARNDVAYLKPEIIKRLAAKP